MKRLMILFVIGLFFSPIFAAGLDDPVEGDTSYNFDRVVEHQNRGVVEIGITTEGSGIYLTFECDIELNIHIINSSARLAIYNSQPWDDVNGLTLLYRTDGAMKFLLPYDDIFYILFTNNDPFNMDSNLVVWWATDDTGPQMTLYEADLSYQYNTATEFTCMFREIYWNLTKMELKYEFADGIYATTKTKEVNQKLYNWTVVIDFNKFDTNIIDFKFVGTDTFGNVAEEQFRVLLLNHPTVVVPPTDPPIGLFIIMFGLVSICGLSAGFNYLRAYRKEGMEAFKPKASGKKRKKRV